MSAMPGSCSDIGSNALLPSASWSFGANKSGWLNLDVLDRAQPDLLLDLAAELALPLLASSPTAGPLRLDAGSIDIINANNVLEHVADLPALMGNCLRLLKVGGEFQIEVPYERAATAWQDPTHVRAMNENSWVYYTDWFWYLGWLEHRFAIEQSVYLDLELREAPREQASFMRVVLAKVETTLRERMTARTFAPQIDVPDDAVDASWAIPGAAAALPAAAVSAVAA